MVSPRSNALYETVTPIETSLASTIVAYMLCADLARHLVSPATAATLFHPLAVAIAASSTTAIYAWVWFSLIPSLKWQEHEDFETLMVETIIVESRIRESIAEASRWVHHLLGCIAGAAFGVALASGLAWLLS